MNRTRNATRNILFGTILRVYQIVVPFLMRTAMIYFMGVEYLGLNSLFTSVLQVLNLAELGVGSAMVYSMYKPIADGDKNTICSLLNLYKKYYFIIGLIIACVGIAITPFIPKLIKGDVPGGLNVYILYLLNLTATVLTYWLFAYKNSLLQAHQRSDVASKVMLVTTTVQYCLQLLVLWLFKNYYLYVMVLLLTTAFGNIATAIVASRFYPEYKPAGKLDKTSVKEINRRIKDLFTAKLGATIVNSADTVVISAYLGLTILAMYQNYYFIMSSVMSIIAIVFSSSIASIGNSMVTEDIEKNYHDFEVITFLINWVVTVCMGCFITMYQPFVTLWVGSEYTFDMPFVTLICIYFYLVTMQQVNGMYKDAAGVWHQDRFRPLIAAIINLGINLLFVRTWGIYAIVLSTIISYAFISMPWMIHNVFKYIFHRDWKVFVFKIVGYFIVACFISLCCYGISTFTSGLSFFIQIILNFIISVIVSNAVIILVFRKNANFVPALSLINKMTRGRINKIIEVFARK